MRIGILSGSHRAKSQSEKVARYVESRLQAQGAETWLYLLKGAPLPFWDDDKWSGSERWQKVWNPVSAELKKCDGYVVVSPEWNGEVPPALKNFFLLAGHDMAHKPALIVAVSSGMGGAYPVVELRMSGYKNTFISYLPNHIIIRKVESLLNDPEKAADDTDTYVRARIDHDLGILKGYTQALKGMRETTQIDLKTYGNGM